MHENIWLHFQAPPHLFSQIMENIVTEHLRRSLRMRLTCTFGHFVMYSHFYIRFAHVGFQYMCYSM